MGKEERENRRYKYEFIVYLNVFEATLKKVFETQIVKYVFNNFISSNADAEQEYIYFILKVCTTYIVSIYRGCYNFYTMQLYNF